MEVRSSERVRTLVTKWSNRGLSGNENARADIHDGPEHNMLQSEAGYIDARPLTASSTKSSCNARPDHTLGQTEKNSA